MKNKAGTSDVLGMATKFCEVPGDSPSSAPAFTFTTLRHCPWTPLQCYCLLALTSKKDNNLEGISPQETAFEALTLLSHRLFSASPRYLCYPWAFLAFLVFLGAKTEL